MEKSFCLDRGSNVVHTEIALNESLLNARMLYPHSPIKRAKTTYIISFTLSIECDATNHHVRHV